MPWGAAPPQPPTAKTDACANRHSRRSVLPNARAGPRRPLATQTPYPPTTTHIGRNLHQLNRLMPCRPLASHQKPYHETCSCTSQNLRQEMARSRYGSRLGGGQRARTKRRPPPHAAAGHAHRATTTTCDSNAVPLPRTHIGRNLLQLNRLMPCRPLASHQKPYHETCYCTSQNLRQEMARSRYGSRPEGVQHVRNKRRSPLHAYTTARSRHRCCRCGCHRRRHGRYRRCRRSAASAAAVAAATVAAAKPLSLTSPSSPPSPLPLSRRCRRHTRA